MNTGDNLDNWVRPRTVVLLTLVLLAALWTAVLLSAVADRQDSLTAASEALQRTNRAIEEQTRLQMRLADLALAAGQAWLDEHSAADPWRSPAFHTLRERLWTATDSAVEILLLTTDGSVFTASGEPRAEIAAALAESKFSDLVQQAQTTALVSGTPLRLGSATPPRLPIARRLENPGVNGYTLFALLDLSRLAAGYDAQRQKPGGSIALLRRDGTLLAGAPFDARRVGLLHADPRASDEGQAGQPEAAPAPAAPAAFADDDAGQFSLQSHMPDFGWLIVGTVDRADALAPWFRHTIWVVLLALGMTIPLAVVAYRSLQLLRVVARHEAQLQHLATTDRLTGTFTRQHFVEILREELAHAGRRQHALTVVSFDIDFFRRINDGYGHDVGDQVLIAFAKVAKGGLRDVDVLGRVSSGQFSILLPNADVHAATVVAERIRRGVAAISIATEDGSVQFTVSAGMSAARPGDRSVDELLKRVDQALHEAVAAGHDRIAIV
ncbi:MAG: diguanylate cyclase [Candidatus Accumulibacter sp.]|uniref:sensor domain-containing diguanylate cyclase n=1 Tax=Accumulibacter sp. TaxID=2053492 RepID=UPI0028792DA3|nr:diguanylate cyclase [Accumulibacter sp.]MDS4015051.1 diguanylate cyclase [Accumulibacter sp.]